MERAAVLCDGPFIEVEHLGGRERATFAARVDAAGEEAGEPAEGLRGEIQRIECERIANALVASDGNRSLAARQLGISRGALLRRMEQFGLGRTGRR
jgi:DNA-binding NtrC family response regulator